MSPFRGLGVWDGFWYLIREPRNRLLPSRGTSPRLGRSIVETISCPMRRSASKSRFRPGLDRRRPILTERTADNRPVSASLAALACLPGTASHSTTLSFRSSGHGGANVVGVGRHDHRAEAKRPSATNGHPIVVGSDSGCHQSARRRFPSASERHMLCDPLQAQRNTRREQPIPYEDLKTRS